MFLKQSNLEALQAKLYELAAGQGRLELESSKLYDMLLQFQTRQLQLQHPNPLNQFGKRCFSQSDEDGITLEILRRLNISKGTFIEVGVGDGRENNTLVLAAMGWQGFWVGGEQLAYDPPESKRFRFYNGWVNRDNLRNFIDTGLAFLNNPLVDVLSLDLDGNDYYLIEHLLETGLQAKLFIVEYNAKFMPPIEFCIDYNPQHAWAGDDYFGASLSSFVNLFKRFNYTLVCCNSHTGANAFFVHNSSLDKFSDVPVNLHDLYVEPRYLLANRFGHPVSVKTILKLLK